jgi:putative tryptophan/tyrosine transport system substrate-binding protein
MNNERRTLLVAMGGLALWSGSVGAQSAARMNRVAYVITTAALKPGRLFATLRGRLAGRSFIEGVNLDLRFFALRPDEEVPQSPERVIGEVLAWQPAAIVAGGVTCARRLARSTTTIPIVFFGIQDPESQGLVASLARPGGNVTGTGVHYDGLAIKRLEVVRELLPSASRVVVVTDRPHGGMSPAGREALERAGKRLGLAVTEIDVGSREDGLCAAGRLAHEARADAAMIWGNIERPVSRRDVKAWYSECVVSLQREAHIPLVDDSPGTAEEGAAFGMGEDLDDAFRRAADIVGEILMGSPPAMIPVDMQMRVRMVVNERTLRELGLALPPSLRMRAHRIVE